MGYKRSRFQVKQDGLRCAADSVFAANLFNTHPIFCVESALRRIAI